MGYRLPILLLLLGEIESRREDGGKTGSIPIDKDGRGGAVCFRGKTFARGRLLFSLLTHRDANKRLNIDTDRTVHRES